MPFKVTDVAYQSKACMQPLLVINTNILSHTVLKLTHIIYCSKYFGRKRSLCIFEHPWPWGLGGKVHSSSQYNTIQNIRLF